MNTQSVFRLPEYLKKGSVIGITCPSGYVSEERLLYAIKIFKDWGFEIKLGNTIGTEYNYFSGTDVERLKDLQMMLDDSDVDAIFMGRGGYGMSRIVDNLNFDKFFSKPKWICGFSDITVLHNHLHKNYSCASLHSPMSGHFKNETENSEFLLSFNCALTGIKYSIDFSASKFNKQGVANGILTGGNLSLFVNCLGTKSEVDTNGKILFLEDVGEYLYNIDRMMIQLKRAGKLENLGGLIFGGFSELKDTERPFGQTVEELLFDKVSEYEYPVAFSFPAGHQDVNFTLMFGGSYRLDVNDKICSLNLVSN